MPKYLIRLALVVALVAAACGESDDASSDPVPTTEQTNVGSDNDSDDPFADLNPVRAIEQNDDAGRPYLSPWDVDPAVADLQQRAVELGLPVEVSGVYDDDTLAIVLAFQYSQGLIPDGVIGPNTWDAIEDPKELPDEVDALTLVEIAEVAATSPSDARQMLSDLGLPPPVQPPGAVVEEPPASSDDETPAPSDDETPAPSEDEPPAASEDETPAPSEDELPAAGDPAGEAVLAVVHLSSQQVDLVDSNGAVIFTFPISSGRDGLTPVGTFKIQSKSELAFSATDYPDISMQWMTRFNGGIGFHGIPVKNGTQLETPLGQAPVSAGCVRMDDADAKVMFDLLPVGADVIVEG